MYKLIWKELNSTGKIAIKKKCFKTESAFNQFVNQLWGKENFLGIIL